MMAAAADSSTLDSSNTLGLFEELGWPDAAIIIILMIGIIVGRRRGMSTELLSVLQWISIVIVGGIGYEYVSPLLMSGGMLSPYFANIVAYLLVAVFFKLVFSGIRRYLGEKLFGGTVFGVLEYYLGMLGGMVRFACVIIFCLALLNARLYSPKEMADMRKYQQENFGSISFPTPMTLQENVFRNSLTGPLVKNSLSMLMIKPTAPGGGSADSMKARRERDVFDTMK
jgi:uncharacterized membrane protein required for colicin V production